MRTISFIHRLAPVALALAAAASLAEPLEAQRRGDDDRDDRGEYRQRVDTTFAFDRNGTLNLGIVSGEIRVVGANTTEARVIASIERGRLETSFSRSRISIEVRSVNGRMGSARYELTVPIGTRVTANAVSGDIDIRATEAEVTAGTVSGDISVRGANRRVELSTVSGDFTVGQVNGTIRLESVSSDLIADELIGDLTVETVSGEIELRRSRLTGIRASTVSGDLRYDGPFSGTGTYDFKTHSGDVEFALPANIGARLELETYSGRIASDFPLTLQPGELGGRRDRRMSFTLGAGGTRITAETFSGNITIRRLPASGNQE